MTQKKDKMDWIERAQISENPIIQELTFSYFDAKNENAKKELEKEIIKLLDDVEKAEQESKKIVDTEIQKIIEKEKERQNKESMEYCLSVIDEKPFKYTADDVEKTDDRGKLQDIFDESRNEMGRLEKNRKVVETTNERKARNQVIFAVKVIGNKARHKIFEMDEKDRIEAMKGMEKIFALKQKQNTILDLIQQNISFDNMIRDYFTKDEFITIMNNQEFLEKCEELRPGINKIFRLWYTINK